MNKNILKHIIRYILIICIIVLCCKIFSFSSENGEISSNTSRKVTSTLLNIFGIKSTQQTIEIFNPIVRKLAHFGIYMLLGILLMCASETFKWQRAYKFDVSTMFAFLFSCSDELHQRFIPGRSGEFADVCLDTVGALIGVILILIIALIIKQNHLF